MIKTLTMCAVVMLSLANPVFSQAKVEPICAAKDARENFACSLEGSHFLCALIAKKALFDNDWVEFTNCKRSHQQAVRAAFDKVRASLGKKAAALTEAKEAYAQWLTAVDGLAPKSGETRDSYNQRTAALDDALTKRIAAFKIEAGIE